MIIGKCKLFVYYMTVKNEPIIIEEKVGNMTEDSITGAWIE